mmetsp:Transcript_124971/g.216604  ORF Transcript_124971/g.216604 Transcript_124971/m.216604 type:complete len:329 (+) Transcript_124971:78-1064(+)
MSASLDEAPLAFGLVILAGMSTAIGAAAVFEKRVVKLASKPVLAAGLGFSGGVMIYVSFIEIFGKSSGAFEDHGHEENWAYVCATICFFSGMLLMKIISFLVHLIDKDHKAACDPDCIDEAREISVNIPPLAKNADSGEEGQAQGEEQVDAGAQQSASEEKPTKKENQKGQEARKLQRMGINTAAAIAIHNFPEGLATFVATLMEPSVGVTLAIAIGIHNIPEGLCVALPIYYATDSRLKGFLLALFSGISEPIGALIGYAIIKSTGDDMNQLVYGILFGIVGGMMVMIVISELLPTAYHYDPKDRFVTNSVVLGMAVMAASLCLFLA